MSDQTAVIGSLVVVAGLLVVMVLATKTYRKSMTLAAMAITAAPSQPLELICGIRIGLMNASWPAGRVRIADEGIGLSCLGVSVRAAWSDVRIVELVKPLNQIGWGVRFRIPTRRPHSAIVWLGTRALAERVIEACTFHKVPSELKPHAVL